MIVNEIINSEAAWRLIAVHGSSSSSSSRRVAQAVGFSAHNFCPFVSSVTEEICRRFSLQTTFTLSQSFSQLSANFFCCAVLVRVLRSFRSSSFNSLLATIVYQHQQQSAYLHKLVSKCKSGTREKLRSKMANGWQLAVENRVKGLNPFELEAMTRRLIEAIKCSLPDALKVGFASLRTNWFFGQKRELQLREWVCSCRVPKLSVLPEYTRILSFKTVVLVLSGKRHWIDSRALGLAELIQSVN